MALECYRFQADAVAAVRVRTAELRAAGNGSPRVALVAPTGSGKTAAMGADLVRAYLAEGKRGVWVAPGPSLVMQAATAFLRAGITDLGVLSAGLGPRNASARMQVVSVFTLESRKQRPPADFVVWDECHRLLAPTWQGVLGGYAQADHYGLSATLYGESGDVESLFHAVVVASSCAALVADGTIAPCDVFCPPEASPSSLLRAYGGPGHSLVFCPSHDDVGRVMEDLERSGATAERVLDSTSPHERRAIFARMERGETDVVVGCETFVDGVDFVRATRLLFRHKVTSRRKAFQAIGRVRRTRAGVTDGKRAVVIDPLRAMVQHGMADEASEKSRANALRVCERCFLLTVHSDPCVRCGAPIEG